MAGAATEQLPEESVFREVEASVRVYLRKRKRDGMSKSNNKSPDGAAAGAGPGAPPNCKRDSTADGAADDAAGAPASPTDVDKLKPPADPAATRRVLLQSVLAAANNMWFRAAEDSLEHNLLRAEAEAVADLAMAEATAAAMVAQVAGEMLHKAGGKAAVERPPPPPLLLLVPAGRDKGAAVDELDARAITFVAPFVARMASEMASARSGRRPGVETKQQAFVEQCVQEARDAVQAPRKLKGAAVASAGCRSGGVSGTGVGMQSGDGAVGVQQGSGADRVQCSRNTTATSPGVADEDPETGAGCSAPESVESSANGPERVPGQQMDVVHGLPVVAEFEGVQACLARGDGEVRHKNACERNLSASTTVLETVA